MPITVFRPKQGAETHDAIAELTDAGALQNASWAQPPDQTIFADTQAMWPHPNMAWSQFLEQMIVLGWDPQTSSDRSMARINAQGNREGTGSVNSLAGQGITRLNGLTATASSDWLFTAAVQPWWIQNIAVTWALVAFSVGTKASPFGGINVTDSSVNGAGSPRWLPIRPIASATDSREFIRFFGADPPAAIIAGQGSSLAASADVIECVLVFRSGLGAGFDFYEAGNAEASSTWDTLTHRQWRRNPNNDIEITGLNAGERVISVGIDNVSPASGTAEHTCYGLVLQSTNLRSGGTFPWTPKVWTAPVSEEEAAANRRQVELTPGL